MLKLLKSQHVLALTDNHVAAYHKTVEKLRKTALDNRGSRRVVMEKLVWKPPVFTREQLRFGW